MSTTNNAAFRLQQLDPLTYQRETRKASIIVIIIFAASAMLLSSLLALLFGSSETSNFKWNLSGVLLGLMFTVILVKHYLCRQPWMHASMYGWRLTRNLMKVTNIMHLVKQGVEAADPAAIRVLRFYHLGLLQMHKLDGNPDHGSSSLVTEINQLLEQMQQLGIDPEQAELPEQLLEQIKSATK